MHHIGATQDETLNTTKLEFGLSQGIQPATMKQSVGLANSSKPASFVKKNEQVPSKRKRTDGGSSHAPSPISNPLLNDSPASKDSDSGIPVFTIVSGFLQIYDSPRPQNAGLVNFPTKSAKQVEEEIRKGIRKQ